MHLMTFPASPLRYYFIAMTALRRNDIATTGEALNQIRKRRPSCLPSTCFITLSADSSTNGVAGCSTRLFRLDPTENLN